MAIGDVIICKICGKEFVKDAPNRRFCSPTCSAVGMYKARLKNQGHSQEVRKEWEEKNREKMREYRRKYYAEHREKIKAQHREYARRKKENKQKQVEV